MIGQTMNQMQIAFRTERGREREAVESCKEGEREKMQTASKRDGEREKE